MPVCFSNWAKGPAQLGMPTVVETGVCTADEATMATLRQYETGRVELATLPRTAGIVAKALDGQQTLATLRITKPETGDLPNCLQIGRTTFQPFAPIQPIGDYKGKQLLSYRRQWIQLSTATS